MTTYLFQYLMPPKHLFLLLLIATPIFTSAQKERSTIENKYKWDLTDLYSDDQEWHAEKESFKDQLKTLKNLKGTLCTSADNLLAGLNLLSQVNKNGTRLFGYASKKSDEDTRNMSTLGKKQEMEQIYADLASATAFVEPEILDQDWSKIENFINSQPKLSDYDQYLSNLFRTRKHFLSENEEQILALSSLITKNSANAYSTFLNAEMPSPTVELNNGNKVTLNSSSYSLYRATANRANRKLIFDNFWSNYKNYQATFGQMLYGQVKKDIFYARARNYKSSLESALDKNNIPVDVYHSLISNVNKNLPTFHRYLKLKKRLLEVDTLHYYDIYASPVKGVDLKYTFDESIPVILDAFKPLGSDYVSIVKKAFNDRWIDVYPNTGKRSGAYSSGSAYDVHPYILLNYNDQYTDVSTLAHELGHTMQSYYSNKNQPFPKANYSIFVAEVASTFNEALLFEKMQKELKEDNQRLSLLMAQLDKFKGTFFRQTQFAEFELKIHQVAEAGTPLTGETLTALYNDILRKYYGHDQGICLIDGNANMEWAFIPHFYYNFYVYQYATSFTASMALASKVINNEKGAKKRYLEFLSSGSSDYSINLLKNAGVDMTTTAPFNATIESMNQIMDEIDKILEKK